MPAVIPIALAATSAIGNVAGGAAKGRAEGRSAEADYLLKRDDLALNRGQAERKGQFDLADLDLTRRQFSGSEQQRNLQNALRGGLLQGLQDVNVQAPAHIASRMGTITGGLKPSAITGREELGELLRSKAMEGLLKGEQFSPVNLEKLPELSTPPKPGKLDKFLGILGGIGSAAGAAGAASQYIPRYGASTSIPTRPLQIPQP